MLPPETETETLTSPKAICFASTPPLENHWFRTGGPNQIVTEKQTQGLAPPTTLEIWTKARKECMTVNPL